MKTAATATAAVVLAAWLSAPAAARQRGSDLVMIGRSATLEAGRTTRDMVVIGGDADVQGTVEHDLVVVGGSARLAPAASVGHDAVVIGGALEADPASTIGGERTVIGLGAGLSSHLRGVPGFVDDSLLHARPLAPHYAWFWLGGLSFVLLYALIAAGAPEAVEACAQALRSRPVGAFLAGALGLAGLAPFGFLLVVSVVGIAVIPLLALAGFAALALGKASLCRAVGAKLRVPGPAAATAAGALLLLVLSAVPVLGLLVWGLAAIFGFGCALLAGVDAVSRERAGRDKGTAATETTGTAAMATAGTATTERVSPAAGAADEILPRAGFWLRAAALLIDVFAWGLIGGITHLHLLGLGGWALYQVGMWVWKGTTLGGMVVGIKGARSDGRPMDVTVALVRHLASYLSALPLFLGFFWAGFDPEKQTWHDKIAGTIVVRVPHSQALV